MKDGGLTVTPKLQGVSFRACPPEFDFFPPGRIKD